MSRFFRASDSESSDSDESIDVPAPRLQERPKRPSYSSDSENEPRRVVLTQKEKVYGKLKENIRQSRNAEKIKDVNKLLSTFDLISKSFETAKTIIAKEGLTIPRFYIRYLAQLEDLLNVLWDEKDSRTNMSKANQNSLKTLRQKIKKYNREFDTDLASYREGPDPVGYTSQEASSEEDEPEQAVVSDTKKKITAAVIDSDVSSDEDEWGGHVSDSSESDIDLEGKEMEELRRYFLKSTKAEKDTARQKVVRPKVVKQVVSDEDDGGEWSVVVAGGEKPLFSSKAEITLDSFLKKYNEINTGRGKRSTNTRQYLKYLEELFDIAKEKNFGPGILVKIRLTVISALFEIDSKMNTAMDYNSWTKTLEVVNTLFDLLDVHKTVVVSLQTTDEEENFITDAKPYRINGSLVLIVKRLDDELTKIFQHTDCHSTDYLEKLKGERDLCTLIEKAEAYVDIHRSDKVFDSTEVAIIYILHIEHMYYKYSIDEDESEKLMDHLCKVIYSLNDVKQYRQRALLCQIYHHAMHDRWYKAKDLLLMSHLQAIVDHSDAATQVLYNRTICQLGLCAFRHGFIREAHQGLSEIQNTQRAKEFLAQGVPPRSIDKSTEQEAKERSMQIPYHMHINLELLECVYLICAMLLEIPNIACHEYDIRRRLLSRSFHYQLKMSERSPLIGPPENTREHVVAASRAMLKGDWKKCCEYIINEKMNAKVWNLFRNAEKVKSMVIQRIQEESLRTYLLMYSTVYVTVSLDNLCESFELDKQRVYSIVSKMIIQEELSATLDEPTNCLIMHRNEPSRLQIAALSLTDKLSQLTENNEQIIEPRVPGRGFTGTGTWYVPRRQGDDRIAEDKNRQRGFQLDRRNIGDRFGQEKRNVWNANAPNRKRETKVRFG